MEEKRVMVKRKLPATTAKRKGLYIPRSKSDSTFSEPTNGGCSRKRGRNHNLDASSSADFADDISAEDEDFEPFGSSDDDYSDLSSMVEDLLEEPNLILAEVGDGFDVNKGDAWGVDGEEYFDKMYKNGEIYPDYEFGKIKLREWMLFTNRKIFKNVLYDYCIQEGFSVVVTHANTKRYRAKCFIEGCNWHIHASCLPDGVTWAIKSIQGDHTCSRLEEYNSMATPSWAAKKVIGDVRANKDITIKALNTILVEKYGVQLKKSSIYKTRDIALTKIQGGHDTSYGKLPMYCEIVKVTHPGSKAHCTWITTQDLLEKPLQFKDIFISFSPQINGFIQGCRGLIGVDGTHLKSNHGGVLLCAIGLDGNNELFPLAYGVYDNESKGTWSQFFWHLKDCLKGSQREDWTIISDRQKGVESALQDVWPSVSRCFCCRHLCQNFKKTYPGPLMHIFFWRVCNAYSEFKFMKAFEKLKKEAGLGVIKWFKDLGDMKCWARHKFNPALCCDENTSNFVESFNSTFGANRYSPVLTLLDEIRQDCMVKHAERQQRAESWNANGITPKAESLLELVRKDSRTCKVYMASNREVEVKDGHSYLPVCLRSRTCACGQWQISGIPCRHALKAIYHFREAPTSYVSSWYSVETYKQTYGMNFSPIPDSEQLPHSDLPQIHPPTMKRRIGRPSRNRKREDGEKRKGKRSGIVQCRKCKAFGHNSRTCKGGLTAREVREQ